MFLSPPSLSGSRTLFGAVDGFVLSQAKTLRALRPLSDASLQRQREMPGEVGANPSSFLRSDRKTLDDCFLCLCFTFHVTGSESLADVLQRLLTAAVRSMVAVGAELVAQHPCAPRGQC